jgi:hypothetical protein
MVLDSNQNGVIDVGDRVVGVFRVSAINSVGVAHTGDATLTAVFALELLSKIQTSATDMTLGFGPLQNPVSGGNDAIAQWAALNPTLAFLNLGDMPVINSNNTMTILYDHPDWGATNPGALNAIDTFDDDYVGTVPIAELGFTGVYNATTQSTNIDEFWQTVGRYNFDPWQAPAGEDLDVDEPLDIVRLVEVGASPENLISVNVTHQYAYPWGFARTTNIFNLPNSADLQGMGQFVDPQVQSPGWFNIATDTDLTANMVPEPASLAIFAGIFGVAAAWQCRKRRR